MAGDPAGFGGNAGQATTGAGNDLYFSSDVDAAGGGNIELFIFYTLTKTS